MKTAGIDIGTTTISAVVYDSREESVFFSKTIANDSFIDTGCDWERIQKVEGIIQNAKKVLEELFRVFPDIQTIGLTGQMHGILYVDEHGECISPLYTWQDGRGNLPEFDGHTLTEVIRDTYGIPVATGYGLVTHIFNSKKNLIPAGAVSLCTIADYVGMQLCGKKRPVIHISNAASLGFFDIAEYCFKTDTLAELGMDIALLPEVTADFETLGHWNGVPVTVAIGDNQASFLGAVGLKDGVVLLNMGTGGQISVLSEVPYQADGIEARPLVRGKYLLAGASLCGGRAYAILERFFRLYMSTATGKEDSQYDILNELARKGAEVQHKIKVTTTFMGTRVNPDCLGSVEGLSEQSFTPENLAYGVLQGMAQELFDMYRSIHCATGITAERLVASGNGLRKNSVLQNIFKEMFHAELKLAACKEEAACGAAVSSVRK